MAPVGQIDRKSVWGWALYDFANSAFTTLVVTFVFATYFTQGVAPDPISGTSWWSLAVTFSALVVAFLSPVIGAAADRSGRRKPWLGAFTIVAVAATAALYLVTPGDVVLALVVFVVANICYELGLVLYNALLPSIAPRERIGRISGYGWGLGYVGGLLALALALVTLIQPEVPWFGFSKDGAENIRATNLMVAVWFALFSLPLFLWTWEAPTGPVAHTGNVVQESFARLARTFREIRNYRQIVRFLIARLLYNDGLVTIFAFGGIYAAGTFGFTVEQILIFGIVLNVAAGLGAILMGFLDDRLGGKRTIQISLVGLIAATLIAIAAPNVTWLWVAGILIGLFIGPNQSASRSLMARMVPRGKENEFFGFFAFSGKATAFIGPLMLGLLTQAFDSQRAGVTIVVILFVAGFAMLMTVDEKAGIEARTIT